MIRNWIQKRRWFKHLEPAPFKKIPPSSYSPTGKPGSTIAEAGLNFRVRYGNGCGPRSMNGGKNIFTFKDLFLALIIK